MDRSAMIEDILRIVSPRRIPIDSARAAFQSLSFEELETLHTALIGLEQRTQDTLQLLTAFDRSALATLEARADEALQNLRELAGKHQ